MLGGLLNITIIAIYIRYIWRFFKITKGYFSVLILHTFFHIWLVISVAFMEGGIYNKDLMLDTYFNFSAIRLVFYEILFYEVLLFWHKRSKIRKLSTDYLAKPIKEYWNQFAVAISLLFSLYLLLDMLWSPNIFTNDNVSRFNYYISYSSLPFAQVVSYFQQPIALLLGLVFANSRKLYRKIFAILLLFLNIFSSYGTGNEFGLILYLVIYFLTPKCILIFNAGSWRNSREWGRKLFEKYKKYFILLFIGFLTVCGVKIYSFTKVNIFSAYASTPIAAFFYRAFALQGDVWWAVDAKVLDGYNGINQVIKEILGIFGMAEEHEIGIYYLMKLILPESSWNNYIWGNSNLMSGYPAINIAIFGYIGAVIVIVLESSVFYWFSSYVYSKILKKQYFRSFISIYVYIQVQKVVNITGYHYLGNLLPVIFAILLLFIETTSKSRNRRFDCS